MELNNIKSKIVQNYITGLKEAYVKRGKKDKWDNVESIVYGAKEEDILKIKQIYPKVPEELLDILRVIDGTDRLYGDKDIWAYFLGSDLKRYPYFLLSTEQIINNKDEIVEIYHDMVDREYDEDVVLVDKKIINDSTKMKWLHFADGVGSTQLFIDFSPSEQGKVGQVVMFVHDPDELVVIADSFEEYLQKLIDKDYDFIKSEE